MELKKQAKYKKGDKIKFYFHYEDKIGEVVEIEGDYYYALSGTTQYPIKIEKIHGKIINEPNKSNNKGDHNAPEEA